MSLYYSPQAKTLALLPKFTGFLSLLGSLFIFQDVVFRKGTTKPVYHRLMLGMSCMDMTSSIMSVLSTWPTPEGTPGVWLASGTTATCTAQGFFNEFGNFAAPLYNVSLCAYYVLIINMGWKESRMKALFVEPLMHVLPIAMAFAIAVLGIPFTLYNNSGWLCWIAPYPPGCSGDACERGEHSDIFRWIHYAFVWTAILVVAAGMYSIYRGIRRTEERQAQWTTDGEESQRCAMSKKVAIQAALFVVALYLTWFFATLTRIYNIVTQKTSFTLSVLMALTFPLQGFFNCAIYLRPRFLQHRNRDPEASMWMVFCRSMYHSQQPSSA